MSGERRDVRAGTRRAADDAALVLTALGIAHEVAFDAGAWRVTVAAEDEARARHALDEVARERPTHGRPLKTPPATLAGVHLALVLTAIYLWIGPERLGNVRFARGEADAQAILAGEPWRAITALTLHTDGSHLLGNAVFAALFVGALAAAVGGGTALVVTVAAGAAGNLANAWLRAPVHHAVGASTAVFGTVGALSGVAFAQRRVAGLGRAWLAVGAGLALLAMLGSDPDSDVGAHLLGFAAGVPLGYVALRLPHGGAMWQLVQAIAAFAAVAWAWGAALR